MSVPKQTFGGRLYNTFQKKYLDNTLYNMMIVKPFFSCDIKHKQENCLFQCEIWYHQETALSARTILKLNCVVLS